MISEQGAFKQGIEIFMQSFQLTLVALLGEALKHYTRILQEIKQDNDIFCC